MSPAQNNTTDNAKELRKQMDLRRSDWLDFFLDSLRHDQMLEVAGVRSRAETSDLLLALDVATARDVGKHFKQVMQVLEALAGKATSKRGWASQHIRDVVRDGCGDIGDLRELCVWVTGLVKFASLLVVQVEKTSSNSDVQDPEDALSTVIEELRWFAGELERDDPAAESGTSDAQESDEEPMLDGPSDTPAPRQVLRCEHCECGHAEPVDCPTYSSCDGKRASCLGRMTMPEVARGEFPRSVMERWTEHEALHGRR